MLIRTLIGGACLDTRRSVTMSKSSSEAEYRVLSATVSEVTWLVRLLDVLGVTSLKPVTLFCDNKSALQISHNMVLYDRIRH